LQEFDCSDNYLRKIIYPDNPTTITKLDISNNDLITFDLSVFSEMKNLRELYIDNTDQDKIVQEQAISNNLGSQSLVEQLQREKAELETKLLLKEQELSDLKKVILQQLIQTKEQDKEQLIKKISQG